MPPKNTSISNTERILDVLALLTCCVGVVHYYNKIVSN